MLMPAIVANERPTETLVQDEISSSFLLKIFLHPTAQKMMIILFMLGAAAVTIGMLGLIGFGEGTRTPPPSKALSTCFVGFGASTALVSASGFFVSTNYKRAPLVVSADSAPMNSDTPVLEQPSLEV